MNQKPALVLFSHGSLLCGSDSILQLHAERLRATGEYTAVQPGYLNYCTPPVEQAIEQCVTAGAETVIIVPYFLVNGKFVREDLPPRLDSAMALFPNIIFRVAGPLAEAPGMKSAVLQCLATAATPSDWQKQAIAAAKDRCKLREDCPLYASPMCRAAEENP